MKIGILTIHHAYNFGAILQSYATYRILNDLGYDAEFIDYENETFSNERKIFLPLNSLGNVFRNIRSLFQYRQLKLRIQLYEEFYKKMKVSHEKYNSESINNLSGYDVVLTGSDQTFALYLTNNPNDIKPYFQEKIKNIRKVSYASSMGEKFFKITENDNIWMKKCLADFDFLSVREIKSADYIERLLGKRPEIVLDPTLLLSPLKWKEEMVETKFAQGDFIAFYTVLSAPWVIKYVETLSIKTGLKVIAMHPRTRYEMRTPFNYLGAIGPGEFLTIINKAKYVVTTSFHATVFSILFRKKFVSLCIGEGNRQKTLLNIFNIQTQLVTESFNCDYSPLIENEIDYEFVHKKLLDEQKRSISFLQKALI